jgi:predicted sugar kinase
LLGLLPALIERDAQTFGEAVFDFNARVGELFAPVQGGTYASKSATGLIDYLRREGVPGVGQSSWGPTVFAFVRDADHAAYLSERVRALLPEAETWIAAGVNRGYTMERGV